MIELTQKTYREINTELAKRVVKLRKIKKITQATLARKSGVSFASVKRFEQTGEISLSSLTKIAIALGAEDDIDNLFTNIHFASLEELLRAEDL